MLRIGTADFFHDACRAIAYHLFNAFEAKSNSNKLDISESDCYDIYENVCTTKQFDGYSLKPINGVNELNGDGLATSEVAGMSQGGGKVPERFARLCQDMSEERETLIYGSFRYFHDDGSPRRKFSREVCIDLTICDGDMDESRYLMEDKSVEPVKSAGKKKKKKKKRKKKKKKKRTSAAGGEL